MSDYESGYDPKYGYNRNAFAHKTIPQMIVGRTVKLIALPIGLVSEAIHSRRDSNKASSGQAHGHNSTEKQPANSDDEAYVTLPANQADELIATGQAEPADGQKPTHDVIPVDDGIEHDEADWALDEATGNDEENSADMISEAPPSYSTAVASKKPLSKLLYPVILPQRRPRTKSRGFVRAYAPALQNTGIEQDAFLGFLKDLHSASQAAPIFDIIIIGTAIAGVYPNIVSSAICQAVQIAAQLGQEAQERYRTNKFLDKANKELFMPRGLYALVVKYKPGKRDETEVESQTIDMGATAMVKYGGDLSVGSGADTEEEDRKMADRLKLKMQQRFRVASGETQGEDEFPLTCAPLIFPALEAASNVDALDVTSSSSNAVSKPKATSKFVNDYFDRRAQAIYAAENPNSTLTAQMGSTTPQFKSRYADPNNHTNMHFFTLITGGKWKAEPLGAKRRYMKAQKKAEERRLQGLKEKSTKRFLQEDVLYLMVVNMPTEEELAKAREEIKAAKERKKQKKEEASGR